MALVKHDESKHQDESKHEVETRRHDFFDQLFEGCPTRFGPSSSGRGV